MTIIITPVPVLKDNYVWIMANAKERTAIVVDPGDASPVIDYLQQHQLKVCAVFITHHHWDHTNGLSELIRQCSAPVFGSIHSIVQGLTHRVSEDQAVVIDTFPPFRVMDIPGHTLDHIAYYSPGILFCGDTLFSAGCGRVFEGSAAQLYRALQKMAALPDDTGIYCGHEYTLNNLLFAQQVEPGNEKIGIRIQQVSALREKNRPSLPSFLSDERDTNPFLRCTSPEIIQHAECHAGHVLLDSVDVFSELRAWKSSRV